MGRGGGGRHERVQNQEPAKRGRRQLSSLGFGWRTPRPAAGSCVGGCPECLFDHGLGALVAQRSFLLQVQADAFGVGGVDGLFQQVAMCGSAVGAVVPSAR